MIWVFVLLRNVSNSFLLIGIQKINSTNFLGCSYYDELIVQTDTRQEMPESSDS